MGIAGLLPVLKPICESKHVDAFAQRRVGVDASSWLHKGAFSCALDLATGAPTRRYVDFCMHRVRMLLHFGAVPVLVFDGAPLPMKAATNARRRELRAAAVEAGRAALERGDRAAAADAFQRGIEITHEMSRELIKAARKLNVEYVVAPYEADAQLAWMAANGHVHLVVTEDSDLVVYGAARIFYKMSRCGQGELFEAKNLTALDDPDFRNFTPQMLTWVCVLAGCDFFPGVQGLGIRKAHTLVKRFRNLARVINVIRFDPKFTVASEFGDHFQRACLVFKHQTVYDMNTHANVHLKPLDAVARATIPEHVLRASPDAAEDLDFLGRFQDPSVAKRLALGELHPRTLIEYADPLDVVERPVPLPGSTAMQQKPAASQSVRGNGFQVFKSGGTPRSPFFKPAAGMDRQASIAALFRRPSLPHVGSTAAVREAFNPPRRVNALPSGMEASASTTGIRVGNDVLPSADDQAQQTREPKDDEIPHSGDASSASPKSRSARSSSESNSGSKSPDCPDLPDERARRPPSPDADVLERFAAIEHELTLGSPKEKRRGEGALASTIRHEGPLDIKMTAASETINDNNTPRHERGAVFVSPFFNSQRLSLPVVRTSPKSLAKRRKMLTPTKHLMKANSSKQHVRTKTLANLDALRRSGLRKSTLPSKSAGGNAG